jgi:hypothetical protein
MIKTIGALNEVCLQNQGYVFMLSPNIGLHVYNSKPCTINFDIKGKAVYQLRFDGKGNVDIYKAHPCMGWSEKPINRLMATECVMSIGDNGVRECLPECFLATIYEYKPHRQRILKKYFGSVARLILYGNKRENFK